MSRDESKDYDGWPAPQKAIAFAEAQRVLEAQRETLADIDDKALRTVRVTAILFGVFVATARVAEPEAFHSHVSVLSGICLFCSFIGGVVTYSESTSIVFGPNDRYVRRMVRNEYPGTIWHDDYLINQSYWIDDNYDVIAWNSQLLDLTQSLLLLGIALVGSALLV